MEITNDFAQQVGVIPTHQHIRVLIVVSNSGANAREDLVDAAMQIHVEDGLVLAAMRSVKALAEFL